MELCLPFPHSHCLRTWTVSQVVSCQSRKPRTTVDQSHPTRVTICYWARRPNNLIWDRSWEASSPSGHLQVRAVIHSSQGERTLYFFLGGKETETVSSLLCPACQQELQGAELGEHLQYEIGRLRHLLDREMTSAAEASQSSAECSAVVPESPSISLSQASKDEHKVEERQQTFLHVKVNREARIGDLDGSHMRGDFGLSQQDFRGDLHSVSVYDLEALILMEDNETLEDLSRNSSVKRTRGEINPSGLSLEMLKAQIQDLRHQLVHRGSSKCHICWESYSVPLTSIQCWHIHCEQCWLRTLRCYKLLNLWKTAVRRT
ncbi:E3 ubiquitin-protein ligase RNF220-like isoform X2 [Hemicordylus capensis]|uniref:E3 ubiquitin-protein ligase RNF220-like isoform X2 n=1 Tax=Hemicordylus capensis TaxID=884348 RepID=UPI002303B3D2|nr:E3 ubiquitin-protein ligase RNF220-like isoform X2 [Hemicordylus capensis]